MNLNNTTNNFRLLIMGSLLLSGILITPSMAYSQSTAAAALTLQQQLDEKQKELELLQKQLSQQQQQQQVEDQSMIKVNGTGDPCAQTGNYLTTFNCGTIDDNNTRHFTLIAQENVLVNITDEGQQFLAWAYNGSIPGPTLRMTEGDYCSSHGDKQRHKQTATLFAYALNPSR